MVDLKDLDGNTALMWATKRVHRKAVQCLLGYKASTEHRNHSGHTALSFAARWGDLKIAQLLIENGASIDHIDNKIFETALLKAARRGHPHITKLLLEHGADFHHKNIYGQTALSLALAHRNKETYEVLFEYSLKFKHKTQLLISQKQKRQALVKEKGKTSTKSQNKNQFIKVTPETKTQNTAEQSLQSEPKGCLLFSFNFSDLIKKSYSCFYQSPKVSHPSTENVLKNM